MGEDSRAAVISLRSSLRVWGRDDHTHMDHPRPTPAELERGSDLLASFGQPGYRHQSSHCPTLLLSACCWSAEAMWESALGVHYMGW